MKETSEMKLNTPPKKLKQVQLPFVKKSDTSRKRKQSEVDANDDNDTIITKSFRLDDKGQRYQTEVLIKDSNVTIGSGNKECESTVVPVAVKSNAIDKSYDENVERINVLEMTVEDSKFIDNVSGENDEPLKDECRRSPLEANNKTTEDDLTVTSQTGKTSETVPNTSVDQSLDSSICSVEFTSENDESMTTDKSTDISSSTISTPGKLKVKKKLTAKQLLKRQEWEQKKKEIELQRQEKERKRKEEKEEKIRLRHQKEEQKRLEREQKEEQKRLEKEQKEKKRQAEIEAKNEEKKQKEDERKMKEEEKRLKEEEKRQKEEQDRKNKEKVAAVFSRFFQPKSKSDTKTGSETADNVNVSSKFMPFEVKSNMRLSNVTRAVLSEDRLSVLDKYLHENAELGRESLYIQNLKSQSYVRGHSENTWPLNDYDDDIETVEDAEANSVEIPEVKTRYRCKFLQFYENRRPAYRGTWRKRSKSVSGRKPFARDPTFFDYEVDSDDEWEDEEPGESLNGSDDEKESEDDYEVDNEVFVPHGYLSDEEVAETDAEQGSSSPQSLKLKLDYLEKEFEEERKEKTKKLRPRVFGCIWLDSNLEKGQGADSVENLLLSLKAVYAKDSVPFKVPTPNQLDVEESPPKVQSIKTKPRSEFPEQYIPDFIKLLHGNKKNSRFLAKEFAQFLLSIDSTINLTDVCIIRKIKEISSWTRTAQNIFCWYVHDDVRSKHDLLELSHLSNKWTYITDAEKQTPSSMKNRPKDSNCTTPDCLNNSAACKPLDVSTIDEEIAQKKNNIPLITKFAKVLTPEEKQKQLESAARKSANKTEQAKTSESANGGNSASKATLDCVENEQSKKKKYTPLIALFCNLNKNTNKENITDIKHKENMTEENMTDIVALVDNDGGENPMETDHNVENRSHFSQYGKCFLSRNPSELSDVDPEKPRKYAKLITLSSKLKEFSVKHDGTNKQEENKKDIFPEDDNNDGGRIIEKDPEIDEKGSCSHFFQSELCSSGKKICESPKVNVVPEKPKKYAKLITLSSKLKEFSGDPDICQFRKNTAGENTTAFAALDNNSGGKKINEKNSDVNDAGGSYFSQFKTCSKSNNTSEFFNVDATPLKSEKYVNLVTSTPKKSSDDLNNVTNANSTKPPENVKDEKTEQRPKKYAKLITLSSTVTMMDKEKTGCFK